MPRVSRASARKVLVTNNRGSTNAQSGAAGAGSAAKPPIISKERPPVIGSQSSAKPHFGQTNAPPPPNATAAVPPRSRSVEVNRVLLDDSILALLERGSGTRIQDGAYWYDKLCGAWGICGGPCLGLIQPGLPLGGTLMPDASNGNTGVFVNGRQLHVLDVVALQQITMVLPGRYWLDAQGNFGYEGGPLMGNLMSLAQLAGRGARGGNGDNFWTSRFSAGNYDPNSGSGYVSVPGYGPVGFGPG